MFEYSRMRYLGNMLVLKKQAVDPRSVFLTKDACASLLAEEVKIRDFIDDAVAFADMSKKFDLPLNGGGEVGFTVDQLQLIVLHFDEVRRHAGPEMKS